MTETFDKTISLLEEGYTYPSITKETGITPEDASAIGIAYFKGETEQMFRELQLAGVLELAALKLRSGDGWDEGTTGRRARRDFACLPPAREEGARAGAAVGQVLKSNHIWVDRLRALGNAVVPQIPMLIGRFVRACEEAKEQIGRAHV